MPHDPHADFAACRALLRAGSKSFALVSRLLPTEVRTSATALYAFCRVADDAIDDDPAASEETVAALRERIDRAYAGCPDDSPVDRALAATVARHGIPRSSLEAFLEGLVWDAQGRRYETIDDLRGYALRVAGTVGVMMSVVMGARDATVLSRACDLGVAMQLTNIARDVGEDARRGRIYVPLAWMRAAGVAPEGFLAAPEASAAVGGLVASLLAHADAAYRRADAGIALLPRRCRVAILAARLVYADIGRSIVRAGFDTVTRRAVVPAMRKLCLLVAAIRGLWLRPQALVHPVESVPFLLDASARRQ